MTGAGRTRAPAISVVLLVISALIFSTGGLFVRSLEHPQAWTTVFWRSFAACVSLSLLIVWRERGNWAQSIASVRGPGAIVAMTFSASSIAMVVALSRTSVAIVLVIFSLSPLAAALLAWIFLRERVPNYTWLAIAITVGGVVFMVSGQGSSSSLSGILVALTIPLAFGSGIVMIRRHREISMLPAMLVGAAMSFVISIPFAHPLEVTRHDFFLLLVFGGAQLGVGLAVFSIGAPKVPATEVALLSMLEPIAGPIWVWVFKDEYPGVPALIGAGIVFGALAAHTVYASSQSASQPTRALAEVR